MRRLLLSHLRMLAGCLDIIPAHRAPHLARDGDPDSYVNLTLGLAPPSVNGSDAVNGKNPRQL